MKRVEKSGGRPAEKQENLGEKLRRGAVVVGKRGGQTTPVLPFWRLELLLAAIDRDIISGAAANNQDQGANHTPIIKLSSASSSLPFVSARKLAALIWELYQYDLPFSKIMNQGFTVPPPRRHRLRHHRDQQHHLLKDDALDHSDPSPSSPDLPGSAGSLRRHVAATLLQHHRQLRNNHAIQPVSPASYGSSMEVAAYNPAGTHTSSIEFKGRVGETSYSLKTSTELLKVLNRIWSLEEQHASNMSLVRALTRELEHARSRIKELVRDQQADRREIDELMKQITEDKLVRKSKEQDRITAAIQSARDELEDERKLRKRSESLHRKLARELYEVKTSLATSLKELEKERETQQLLEDLCDEFAWGIREYEQEVHALKQKCGKEWGNRDDRLILHISESWLDERLQMKLEPQSGPMKKKSVMEKLGSEIKAFIKSKNSRKLKSNVKLMPRDTVLLRSSLESIPLNVALGVNQDDGADEDPADVDLNCFELTKPTVGDSRRHGDEAEETHIDETVKSNLTTKKTVSHERIRGNPAGMQAKFEHQIAQAAPHNENKNSPDNMERGGAGEGNPVEMSISRRSEICEVTEEGTTEKKDKVDGTPESNINSMIDNLIRNHYLLSESGNGQHEKEFGIGPAPCGNPAWRSQTSPVRRWTAKLPLEDLELSESSSKLPQESKENTLRAKLLEARTRGQRSRSRLKGSKIIS